MLNIVIIGTGNVSHHLCKTIENSKVLNLLQLFGRNEKLPENFNQKIVYTNNLDELKKADFYIICVSDDAILEISDKLILKDSIIVHTSGSTRLDILSKHKNHGVLFLKNRSEKLVMNQYNINDVIDILGQPHSKSISDDNQWIYIERVLTNGEFHKLG